MSPAQAAHDALRSTPRTARGVARAKLVDRGFNRREYVLAADLIEVPGALEQLVKRTLHTGERERHAACLAILRELRQHLEPIGVGARDRLRVEHEPLHGGR